MREHIISEIRRLTNANEGKPLGAMAFERETGIRSSAWRGVYWARWSDALAEAGFTPNSYNSRIDDGFLLQKLAEAFRHYGKIPSNPELRMYRRVDADFPYHSTLANHFPTKRELLERLREWLSKNDSYADVAAMLPEQQIVVGGKQPKVSEGWVYLIRWGANFKIGRGEQLEQRVKQVQTKLPDKSDLVHAIRTDDPAGIEVYWHRRFADKRAEGEWFKLSAQDVAAFKRRKYQ